jgi:hypothetical protein
MVNATVIVRTALLGGMVVVKREANCPSELIFAISGVVNRHFYPRVRTYNAGLPFALLLVLFLFFLGH